MRSDIRALIVSIVLFGLWGTVITCPFRLVSDIYVHTAQDMVGKLPLPALACAFIILVLVMGVTCILLFLGKREISDYLALIFSLIACTIYCFKVWQENSFSVDAAAVTAVVAISVVLVIFRKTEWTRYIADAFIFSLPVHMFYDCIMNPLYRLIKADIYLLKPFIVVPQTGIFSDVGNLLHVPLLVWGSFFFILSMLPVMYLAGGRREGKIRN